MIEAVETAVAMIGDGTISYGEAEAATARGARRSLFARRHIPRGAVIGEGDLVCLRPGVGIPVYERDRVIGKRSKADIPVDYLIRKEYI